MNIIYETTKERGATILIPTSMVDSFNPATWLAKGKIKHNVITRPRCSSTRGEGVLRSDSIDVTQPPGCPGPPALCAAAGDDKLDTNQGETCTSKPCRAGRRNSGTWWSPAILGWTLDAFDFFLLVFVLKDIAAEFAPASNRRRLGDYSDAGDAARRRLHVRPPGRPLRPPAGPDARCAALFLARLSRPAFAPSITVLLVIRALFGVAMGGEWGIGASLTMETIPPKARGLVSGLLQCGYPTGYLLGSHRLCALFPMIGWRGMFMLGVLPALLVLYIRRSVPESPGWTISATNVSATHSHVVKKHWALAHLRHRC